MYVCMYTCGIPYTYLHDTQICLWDYDDPCNKFPTLYFDVLVDCFFLVIYIYIYESRLAHVLLRRPR